MRIGKAPSGKFPEGVTGQTRDKVGAFAGMLGRTVEKVAAVVRAAERDPHKFGGLLEEMDRTRKVDGVYRKLRQAQDEKRRLAVRPVDGRFRTIVVDPPAWPGASRAIVEHRNGPYLRSRSTAPDLPALLPKPSRCAS
jgi:hypothetical protein